MSAVPNFRNVPVERIERLVTLLVIVIAGGDGWKRESDQLGGVQRPARFVTDARFGCYDHSGLRR